MTPVAWLVGGALGATTLLLLALPALSRPDIFFSVTVSERFRDTPVAQATRLRYQLAVAIAASSALAVFVAVPSPRLRILGVLLQPLVAMLAWAWARRRVLPHAIAPPAARAALLAPRDLRLPGGWLGASGPFVILAAAALFLHVSWPSIPARFATHWNASGTPDGWSTKTVAAVYRTLALGVALVAFTLIQSVLILRRTRQVAARGRAAESELQFKRRNALYGVLSMYAMALLFSYFATRPVAANQQLGVEVWIALGVIVVGAGLMTAWMVRVGQGGSHAIGGGARAAVSDGTPDAAWRAGQFYFNRADPAIFVEKRMGLGWTLNFANPWAWAVLAALFVPVAIVVLMR